MPRAKTAWLQLAGAEMALCAGTPEQIVQLSQRAIELRLVDRDRHGAGLACETAVALLQASRRTDLIGELFEWLCALWTQAPAGSPGALYPALVASDLARSDGFAECLPDPQAFQRAQALHRAAATGDVREVRTLLQAGVDPNARNPRNPGVPTPLLTAAYHGHVDVLTILLDAGADLRAVNVQGRGPLHLAADQDQPEAVRRLVEAGARLDVCDFQWHTPLHIAAWQGHLGCVGELLAGGARLDAPDINGDTALGVAAAAEVPRVVRHLLRAGAPVDLSNDLGQTPLMRAAMEGRLVNVRLLLVAGADPRRTDLNEMSAAEWAAYEGWEALAELLVEGEQAMAEACWRDHHDRLHRRVQMQTPHMAS